MNVHRRWLWLTVLLLVATLVVLPPAEETIRAALLGIPLSVVHESARLGLRIPVAITDVQVFGEEDNITRLTLAGRHRSLPLSFRRDGPRPWPADDGSRVQIFVDPSEESRAPAVPVAVGSETERAIATILRHWIDSTVPPEEQEELISGWRAGIHPGHFDELAVLDILHWLERADRQP